MLNEVARYARTAAGLRPVQWVYLPLRRLQSALPGRATARPVDDRTARLREAVERIGPAAPDAVLSRAAEVVDGYFRFLGHRERLGVPDWRRRYGSQLWTYHLHYFDYARDLAHAAVISGDSRFVDRFVALALSWARQTQPGRGDAWASYPVSLRIVNWVQALALLCDAIPRSSRSKIVESLAAQAWWLERRLEHHLQANHLQKNYYALAVAGLAFEGHAPRRWRRTGLRGSWNASLRQVLADGGHFERSPMYHAIALADFLELITLCNAVAVPVPEDVRERVRRMVDAFAILCRPTGAIHLFNDAAHDAAPSLTHLDGLARGALGSGVPRRDGVLELVQSGYYGVATGAGDRLLIDCGDPGPRHQPAHAHCDILSFELDLGGHPVVVDSGVHGYGGDPWREYSRSTRAHNTVMLGGLEQTEVWGVFRVARMAQVIAAEHALVGHEYCFTGSCRPYHDPRLAHRREIRFMGGRLRVTDEVLGPVCRPIRSFLHLHPALTVVDVDGLTVSIAAPGRTRLRIDWFGVQRIRVGRGDGDPEGWYLPEFGRAEPAPAIVGERTSAVGSATFGYTLHSD